MILRLYFFIMPSLYITLIVPKMCQNNTLLIALPYLLSQAIKQHHLVLYICSNSLFYCAFPRDVMFVYKQ